MTTIKEEKLVFFFNVGVAAESYDKWQHTIRLGKKGLDIVAVENSELLQVTWLIEAKDFRVITEPPRPANLANLADTVAKKVVDSLAGLADAAKCASNPKERSHAARAIASQKNRVVLHLEPPLGPHPALFPAHYSAPNVLLKLRQLVHEVDPTPLVLSIATTQTNRVPWRVS